MSELSEDDLVPEGYWENLHNAFSGRNAAIAKVTMKYIDRLSDPDDEIDPLYKIVDELLGELTTALNHKGGIG